jgi:hypothetical protein
LNGPNRHSGPAKDRNPESSNIGILCSSGFQAQRFALSRNDGDCFNSMPDKRPARLTPACEIR